MTPTPNLPKSTNDIILLESALVQHKLSIIRNKDTSPEVFRSLVRDIGVFLAYEMCRELPTKSKIITTPLMATQVNYFDEDDLALVSILRAGNGLLDGALEAMPFAPVGFLGLERDHQTHLIRQYYLKLPAAMEKRTVLVLDPMLATGHTLLEAIKILKNARCKKIIFGCLVAAPEGLALIRQHFPELTIYAAALDQRLNEVGYILPGLGDAGDRIYGT